MKHFRNYLISNFLCCDNSESSDVFRDCTVLTRTESCMYVLEQKYATVMSPCLYMHICFFNLFVNRLVVKP
jgi:hypothetical protein